MKKVMTLCYVLYEGHALLGLKKRGFGVGHWVGFGGKVQEGEAIEEAAHREVFEEAGIVPLDLTPRGVLNFSFEDGSSPDLEVHIFSVTKYRGEPTETEEMYPQWFAHSDIPYEDMWADDVHWLPQLLDGANVHARFVFANKNRLISHEVSFS